jgi:hypothetical protein
MGFSSGTQQAKERKNRGETNGIIAFPWFETSQIGAIGLRA